MKPAACRLLLLSLAVSALGMLFSGCAGGPGGPANTAPTAAPGGPYTGTVGQAISFDGSHSVASSGRTITSYSWNFGDNTSGTGAIVSHSYATAGTFQVSLTVTDSSGSTNAESTTANISNALPSVSDFNPKSGPIGTVVTVTGANFVSATGAPPTIGLSEQGGGSLSASVSAFSPTLVSFVIPAGAASGLVVVMAGSQKATSATPLTVTTSSSFTPAVAPAAGTLVAGQSTTFAVTISSSDGFAGLTALSVSGLPSAVSANFAPSAIGTGETSVLTLSGPPSLTASSSNLSLVAAALIDGQSISKSVPVSLQVVSSSSAATTFLGRTAVDDNVETPLAGVTVKFLGKDDKGNATGCSAQTSSDGAGNFSFSGLPAACTGPQLIAYDGTTATSPAGKYAGVNLSYTLTVNQVTTSPVLIHLPRIDNAETVEVQQNAATDQIFTFKTIPGLLVTVYAGTTFTLADGTTPNPFPLVAVAVPVDRLPDAIPTSGMLTPFIVAFQPANAVASLPVSVDFPNILNTAPGTSVTLATLDPTRGYMVPYGTGTVSSDGTKFVADPDPAHPGHGYGLVHFDWHGPTPPPPTLVNPACVPCIFSNVISSLDSAMDSLGGSPSAGDPIDIASGLEYFTVQDALISGSRGSISLDRTYRSLSNVPGPFGVGTSHNYGFQLDVSSYVKNGGLINLDLPDGESIPFAVQANGSFTNATQRTLLGAVLTASSPTVFNLRFKNGTVFQFLGNINTGFFAFLSSITDSNGNTTTLTRNPGDGAQLTQITDPVGRSLTLTYDSNDHITTVTDPLGRVGRYAYNAQGALETFTDASGGVTTYGYASPSELTQITDARGIVVALNTYDQNGRVTQQVAADGGVYKISYTLLNPNVPSSPVLSTTETDPLGNRTSYRFDPTGVLLSVIDPLGQSRVFARQPGSGVLAGVSGTGVCPICGTVGAGNVTTATDANGNLLTVMDALGNTTTLTYEPVFNKIVSITDPLGKTSSFTYDAKGNLTKSTDANGKQRTAAYDSTGLPTAITDALGNKTSISYDNFGNPTQITDALGKSSALSYDGVSRRTQFTDRLGRTSTGAYDVLDRVVNTTNPLGNTIQFAYDAVGNLLSLTDERGKATSYTYDGLSRALTRTDPLGKSESSSYDTNGNLTKFVDRKKQTSVFVYDALNRLTKEIYEDGGTATRSYDGSNRLVRVVDSAGGAFTYTYDPAGRLLSANSPVGSVRYAMDADSRVSTRQVAGQQALSYTYDAVGNMLTAVLGQTSATYAYDALNRPQSITRGNQVSSTYSYDPLSRILSIVDAGPSGTLNNQTYSYDSEGQRSSLSTASAQPLTTKAVTSQFDVNNRLLSSTDSTGTTSYSYDDNGNLTTVAGPSGTTTYTWDARDRLVSISLPSGQNTALTYDYARNLITQADAISSAAQTRNFVLDGWNVAAINQSSGDNLSVLAGRVIDQHLAISDSTGNSEYGLADTSNSTTQTTDQTGKSLASSFYEPYGQSTLNQTDYPFQFMGRVPVTPSLLSYRARYYDTSSARFLSEDPTGYGGGSSNLFSFVAGDPINRADPTGTVYASAGGVFSSNAHWGGGAMASVGVGIVIGSNKCRKLIAVPYFSIQSLLGAGISAGVGLGGEVSVSQNGNIENFFGFSGVVSGSAEGVGGVSASASAPISNLRAGPNPDQGAVGVSLTAGVQAGAALDAGISGAIPWVPLFLYDLIYCRCK